MIARVEETTGARFNSIGLNFYRDQEDSVAWHNDHENELAPMPVIALVSLGATREMRLRTKDQPRRTLRLDLEPGSLLVMSGVTQHYWEHTVAKEKRRVGPRISVALRQRRALPGVQALQEESERGRDQEADEAAPQE
jgi:alkylated DNA repair dioxygenase AlkB